MPAGVVGDNEAHEDLSLRLMGSIKCRLPASVLKVHRWTLKTNNSGARVRSFTRAVRTEMCAGGRKFTEAAPNCDRFALLQSTSTCDSIGSRALCHF